MDDAVQLMPIGASAAKQQHSLPLSRGGASPPTSFCGRWRWYFVLLALVLVYLKVHLAVVLLARQGLAFLVPVAPHDHPHSLIVSLLACAGGVLDEHGIDWFLDEGSLLGAIREGDVIRGDSDIDIGTFAHQWHRMPAAADAIRARCGQYVLFAEDCRGTPGFSSFVIKRVAGRFMPGYLGPNWFVDVRAYHVDADGAVLDLAFVDDNDTPFVHVRDILPLRRCSLRGVASFWCPKNSETVLVDEFGEQWRTPMPGFKTYMLQREATYKLLPQYADAAVSAGAGGETTVDAAAAATTEDAAGAETPAPPPPAAPPAAPVAPAVAPASGESAAAAAAAAVGGGAE